MSSSKHTVSNVKKVRVSKEKTAKTQRAQAPVQSCRADTSQPAFTSNRSSHGGGGAFNPLMLLSFVVFAAYRRRKGGDVVEKHI